MLASADSPLATSSAPLVLKPGTGRMSGISAN